MLAGWLGSFSFLPSGRANVPSNSISRLPNSPSNCATTKHCPSIQLNVFYNKEVTLRNTKKQIQRQLQSFVKFLSFQNLFPRSVDLCLLLLFLLKKKKKYFTSYSKELNEHISRAKSGQSLDKELPNHLLCQVCRDKY